LQSLGQVDLVAFDKTGTLTEGRPKVTSLMPSGDASADDLLRLAASVEFASEHPLAKAVVAEADERGIRFPQASDFENSPGGGVTATVEGRVIRAGSAAFLRGAGIAVPDIEPRPETHVYLAIEGAFAGRIDLSDPPKNDAQRPVAALTANGLQVAMLSGDGPGPVSAVANTLGIAEAFGGLSPADKQSKVQAWRDQGLKVAFVGDGINDAPVLAAADVGIALGTGTDVAIEAADVVLVSGNPSVVVTAIEVSRRTLRNIVQNLVWAFGYNVALIPVAAGLLAVFGGPFLNPMLAAGAMAASSVLVVLNALRLKTMRAA